MANGIIGIKLADGTFYPILKEGENTAKKLELTTVRDNQTTVHVNLYRSETSSMEDAVYVDTLVIENLKPHEKQEISLPLSISIDENGTLSAEIFDSESGERGEIKAELMTLPQIDVDEDDFTLSELNVSDDVTINEDFAEIAEGIEEETEDFAEIADDFDQATEDFAEIAEGIEEETEDFAEIADDFDQATEDFAEIAEDFEEETEDFNMEKIDKTSDNLNLDDISSDDLTMNIDELENSMAEPIVESVFEDSFEMPEATTEDEAFEMPEATTEDEAFEMPEATTEDEVFEMPEATEILGFSDSDVVDDDLLANEIEKNNENFETESFETENFETDNFESDNFESDNFETESFESESLDAGILETDDFNSDTYNTDISDNDTLDEYTLSEEELPNFDDIDIPSFDSSDSFVDNSKDSFIMEDETPAGLFDFDDNFEENIPSPSITFTDLYDEERMLPEEQEDEIAKKTIVPVTICIICAAICVIVLLLVMFFSPAKGLFSKNKDETNTELVESQTDSADLENTITSEEIEISLENDDNKTDVVVAEEAQEEKIVIVESPVVEPVVPEPPVEPRDKIHRIRWGDTLWDIAGAYYQNPWLYKKIAKENGIKNPDLIISGTDIVIPGK